MKTSVNAPSSRRRAENALATKSPAVGPELYSRSTRCTAVSVSVSEVNSMPAASSSSRSGA
ncbi:Uncharacterised protein [Mycobacteroides abscessus subsp. abscessus]|nr:Uncharacterised protein [Mycobacteroides abscessus subsp. abscessus]